ncbi:hypothetical protein EVAR_23561_1 [Eumeta japonica]|uniref:Uncharacterized protein n=1 Tax=Eumeta variegata TaxID=151549 RepID=A0A4C1WY02_EUMVA|nr:hypothetical protein EVAR_23561_1 [Eumeta japonica]
MSYEGPLRRLTYALFIASPRRATDALLARAVTAKPRDLLQYIGSTRRAVGVSSGAIHFGKSVGRSLAFLWVLMPQEKPLNFVLPARASRSSLYRALPAAERNA